MSVRAVARVMDYCCRKAPGAVLARARRAWAAEVTEGVRPAHLQLKFAEGAAIDHRTLVKTREIFALVQGGEVLVVAGGKAVRPQVEFVGEAVRVTVTDGFLSRSSSQEIQEKIGSEVQRLLRKKRMVLEMLGFGHDEGNLFENISRTAETLLNQLWLAERRDLAGEAIRKKVRHDYSAVILRLERTLREGRYLNYPDFINRVSDEVVGQCYESLLELNKGLETLSQWVSQLGKANLGKISIAHPAIKGETYVLDFEMWLSLLKPDLSAARDLVAATIGSVEGEVAFDLVDMREALQKYVEGREKINIVLADHLGPYPLVRVNRQRLFRLLDNLIKDADQAMLAAGHKGQITLSAFLGQGKVRMVIQDTGPAGIPEQILEEVIDYRGRPVQRIFTPGVRRLETDVQVNLASMRGLGKMVVHAVAEQFGGTVRAGNHTLEGGGVGGEFVVEF